MESQNPPVMSVPVEQPQPILPQPEHQPQPTQSETPAQSAASISVQFLNKNRLQEYTQKASIPLPKYQTINEGSQHSPMFRSTVIVDGVSYTSPTTFSHRKTSEQDVARIAMLHVSQKIKDEEYSLIREDTIFCKSILNEYATKMHVEIPTYTTDRLVGCLPTFVSSLVFNGKHYIGDKGRNKREAEQLAARAVILSILDSESVPTVISETIKSKSKLYASLDKVKDSCNTQNDIMPVGIQTGNTLGIAVSKGNGFEVAVVDNNMPRTAIAEPFSGDSTTISAAHRSLHEFSPRKQEASLPSEAISTPIIFVPPTSDQLVGSTSGKKRKRKNKKDKQKVGVDAQLQDAVVSSSQPSPCPVVQ